MTNTVTEQMVIEGVGEIRWQIEIELTAEEVAAPWSGGVMSSSSIATYTITWWVDMKRGVSILGGKQLDEGLRKMLVGSGMIVGDGQGVTFANDLWIITGEARTRERERALEAWKRLSRMKELWIRAGSR
jgi:hypothetical protein